MNRTPIHAMAKEILLYWFGEISESPTYLEERQALWFGKIQKVDEEIRQRFAPLLQNGIDPENNAYNRLAAIILFDQFPRNAFRDTPKAFAWDTQALRLTLDGLKLDDDQNLTTVERLFFYLPLEHSEDLKHQEESIRCYQILLADSPAVLKSFAQECLRYAERHAEIIELFGRFPHRNRQLGRLSTPKETEFLQQPNSSF